MKRGHIALYLLCLVVLCSAGKIPPGQKTLYEETPDSLRPVQLFTSALSSFRIYGDSLAARQFAKEAVNLDSTYSPALYLLSRITKDRDEATELARRAYSLDSTNRYYLENLGERLIRSGDMKGAMKCYSALTQQSKDPDHFRILSLLYNGNGQPLSAIAILDSAENKFGRIPALEHYRQQLYISTKQFDKAEEIAKKIIADAPYIAENYSVLGDVYAATGRDSLAMTAYSAAIQQDSTSIPSWLALADHYYKRGNTHEYLSIVSRLYDNDQIPKEGKIDQFKALTSDLRFYRENYSDINFLAQKLIIKYPGDKEVVELYAKHLIASGKLENAVALYKQQLDPNKPDKNEFERIIEIESYLKRPDSVAVYLNKALAAFPNDAEMLAMKGNISSIQERYDEAVEAFEAALKLSKNDTLRSKLWGSIGDIEHQRKNMKKTYSAYNKALKYFKDNSLVLNNYAYFLALDNRDLETAYAMATRACSLTPNNATYIDTLAWVLYMMKRYDEAKKYMQQAISMDQTSSAEMALHYGDILDALGKEFMAQTYWRKALERGYENPDAITQRIENQKTRKSGK